MTVTRAAFVAEARTWINTPYRHQGRLKGVGVDCIGLAICVARACGLDVPDAPDYGRRPDGRLRLALESHLTPVALDKAQAGDVLLFAWNSTPFHVGILSDSETVIHSYLPNRRVVEMRVDEKTRRFIVAAYNVPGVA